MSAPLQHLDERQVTAFSQRSRAGGVLGGALPALLAGGACCAPSLLLLLGLPGLGTFAGFFGWLVPVSLAALCANRVRQRRIGAPPMWASTAPGNNRGAGTVMIGVQRIRG